MQVHKSITTLQGEDIVFLATDINLPGTKCVATIFFCDDRTLKMFCFVLKWNKTQQKICSLQKILLHSKQTVSIELMKGMYSFYLLFICFLSLPISSTYFLLQFTLHYISNGNVLCENLYFELCSHGLHPHSCKHFLYSSYFLVLNFMIFFRIVVLKFSS